MTSQKKITPQQAKEFALKGRQWPKLIKVDYISSPDSEYKAKERLQQENEYTTDMWHDWLEAQATSIEMLAGRIE